MSDKYGEGWLEQAEVERELTFKRRMMITLAGTSLGNYLHTKERRYLTAFIFLVISLALGAAIMLSGIQILKAGLYAGEFNRLYYKKLFLLGTLSSASYSVSAFLNGDGLSAVRSIGITVLMAFLWTLR